MYPLEIHFFCTILSEVSNKWFSAKADFVLDSIVPSVFVWEKIMRDLLWLPQVSLRLQRCHMCLQSFALTSMFFKRFPTSVWYDRRRFVNALAPMMFQSILVQIIASKISKQIILSEKDSCITTRIHFSVFWN